MAAVVVVAGSLSVPLDPEVFVEMPNRSTVFRSCMFITERQIRYDPAELRRQSCHTPALLLDSGPCGEATTSRGWWLRLRSDSPRVHRSVGGFDRPILSSSCSF